MYLVNFEIWKNGKNTGREVGVYVNEKNHHERVEELKAEYPKEKGYELKQKSSSKSKRLSY